MDIKKYYVYHNSVAESYGMGLNITDLHDAADEALMGHVDSLKVGEYDTESEAVKTMTDLGWAAKSIAGVVGSEVIIDYHSVVEVVLDEDEDVVDTDCICDNAPTASSAVKMIKGE